MAALHSLRNPSLRTIVYVACTMGIFVFPFVLGTYLALQPQPLLADFDWFFLGLAVLLAVITMLVVAADGTRVDRPRDMLLTVCALYAVLVAAYGLLWVGHLSQPPDPYTLGRIEHRLAQHPSLSALRLDSIKTQHDALLITSQLTELGEF